MQAEDSSQQKQEQQILVEEVEEAVECEEFCMDNLYQSILNDNLISPEDNSRKTCKRKYQPNSQGVQTNRHIMVYKKRSWKTT